MSSTQAPTSPAALPPGLTIRRVPLTELHADPANARTHGERNIEEIRASLARFGQVEPLVVQRSRSRVIGGNGRLVAMRALGWTHADVVELDVDDVAATSLGIALNRTAELAEWDLPVLSRLLQSLEVEGALDGVGFDEKEISRILDEVVASGESLEGITQDDVPLPPETATTVAGDLWELGSHRLLCGNSSSRVDLTRLLGGKRIQLVNTDPPYNVKVEPRSNNAIAAGLSSFGGGTHHQSLDLARDPSKGKATHKHLRAKDRPLANDFVSDDAFDRMLREWFGNMAFALEPGRTFYIWGGYANCANYPSALKESGLYFSQAVIWVKEHPVLTRKDFMGNHEWCQPGDTMVDTPDGSVSIASLRDGDRVVSYSRNHNALVGLREGLGVRSTSRPFAGHLIGVNVGARQTWCTPGHIWTVKLAPEADAAWCVYLMRRGNWWRVGKSKLLSTWGFGVKQRLSTEGGDEAWILSTHMSNVDAAIAEQVVQSEYGIPTTTWAESHSSRRTLADVGALYALLDLPRLQTGAEAAIAAHGRSLEHPFVRAAQTRGKAGRRVAMRVRACNLFAGVMHVPVSRGEQVTTWEPIRALDRQPFDGPVYSMAVEKYEHYVADGIVTHNCFYGWREGAGHEFFGPNNAVDVWAVKKVNPQSMVHLTEKPVELAARAIQYSSRPGENVLDLFGGSGSTLIGCEQTGRNGFLMELDTLYCDVIVERWQKLTGKVAVLAGTSTTFAQARAQRLAAVP